MRQQWVALHKWVTLQQRVTPRHLLRVPVSLQLLGEELAVPEGIVPLQLGSCDLLLLQLAELDFVLLGRRQHLLQRLVRFQCIAQSALPKARYRMSI